MTGNIFFQIFIMVDVFIMGLIAAVALRHADAHFRPHKHEPEEAPHDPAAPPTLSAATKQRLLHESEEHFQTIVNQSATRLQKDLEMTAEQINNLVKKLATDMVSGELENYHAELVKLHSQAEADMGGIKQEVNGHTAELKAQVAAELAAEKQKLIAQIDTKLADAVGSFLLESLQHNIDLGSQSSYLMDLLEEHKGDFIKEVGGEDGQVQAAK